MSIEHSIETMSGRMFDFDEPTTAMVCIEDIARALGNTARFGGHTRRYYSVAEHAILVYRLLRNAGFPADVCLAGLHHDSHEAYLGDVPTPLKRLLREGTGWDQMEWRIDQAIRQTLGITASFHHDAIKAADQQALGYEAAVLKPSGRAQCGSREHGAWVDVVEADVPDWAINCWVPGKAAQYFRAVHREAIYMVESSWSRV